MKIITDSRCTEYVRLGHPERPQRVSRTVERLREQKELRFPSHWIAEGVRFDDSFVLYAHRNPSAIVVRRLAGKRPPRAGGGRDPVER